MRTSSCLPSYRLPVGLVALSGLLLAACVAEGGPLAGRYTGYTRVGIPPTEGIKSKEFLAVADKPDALGTTVYFMVLKREAAGSGRIAAGDSFGTGIDNFDQTLIAGQNSDRRGLDTTARYLYLYQVVNDSGLKAGVRDTTVRLLVPIDRITSWGHFLDRTTKNDKGLRTTLGLGFRTETTDMAGKSVIMPVSTAYQGVSSPEEPYRLPGVAKPAPKVYGIQRIGVEEEAKSAIVPAADMPAGQDPGRVPDSVTLVPNANFKIRGLEDRAIPTDLGIAVSGDDDGRIGRSAEEGRTGRAGEGDDRAGGRRGLVRVGRDWRSNWPALRASWRGAPITPRQRSILFGFTSNEGPILSDGAVDSKALAANAFRAVGDAAVKAQAAGLRLAAAEDAPGGNGGVVPITPVEAVAAGIDLPAVGGTLPTPAIRAVAETAAADATPAATGVPVAPGGGGGIGGGLGGLGGGVGGLGGGFMPAVPGAGTLAGRSGGGGGFGGGTGGATGNGLGSLTGTNNGLTTTTTATDQNGRQQQQQQQSQSVSVNVSNQNYNRNSNRNSNKNININYNHNHDGKGHVPPGNVVPAPPAWLLGVLGLPVFLFVARRRRKAAAELGETPNDEVPSPA